MNGKLKRMLARFLSDNMPVIRKGGTASNRLITILNPGKALRVISAADVGLVRIEVKDQKYALLTGVETLAEFDSREDAVAVLTRIHKLVSPSPWRWFWRIVLFLLAYNLFVPSSVPQAPYQAAGIASGQSPSTALATMPGPSVAQPVPRNDEPFGLPLGQQASQ